MSKIRLVELTPFAVAGASVGALPPATAGQSGIRATCALPVAISTRSVAQSETTDGGPWRWPPVASESVGVR